MLIKQLTSPIIDLCLVVVYNLPNIADFNLENDWYIADEDIFDALYKTDTQELVALKLQIANEEFSQMKLSIHDSHYSFTYEITYTFSDFGSTDTGITPQQMIEAQLLTKFYEVCFNSMGGDYNPEPLYLKYGDKIPKPADPTRDGYTFDGWYVGYDFSDENRWSFIGFANKIDQKTLHGMKKPPIRGT